MRVHKISLYKRRTKERNIYIIFIIESHFYFENFSELNDKISKKFENDVMSLMTSFVEIRSIEFFTSRILNIWKSSLLIETFFFIIISFSFVVVTISKFINFFFFYLNSTLSFSFSFVSFIIVLLSKLMTFLRFALTLSRLIKTSFHFIKISSRFHFIFIKRLRKWMISRFARLIANWILCAMSKIYFSTRRHCFIKIINLIFRFFTLTKIEQLLLIIFWWSRFTRFVKFQ